MLSVEPLSVKVIEPPDREVPSGIRWVPQVGGVVSMLLTVELVHTLLFPALSVIVTVQVEVFPVRGQVHHPIAIQLSPSVLHVRVAVTVPLVGVVGL